MKKFLTFAAMALLLGASVSCNHNELAPDSLSKSHRIGVRVTGVGTVTKAGPDAPALIDSYVIEDFDGEDIKLDVYVEDNLNGLVSAPETKGGIVDDGTGFGTNINSNGQAFVLNAWLGSENRYNNNIGEYADGDSEGRVNVATDTSDFHFIKNADATYSASTSPNWSISGDNIWRNDVPTSFWSYYPKSISGTRTFTSWPADKASDDAQKVVKFDYTIPTGSNSTQDMLFAYTLHRAKFGRTSGESDYGKICDGYSELVDIKFYHALAAVRFDISGLINKKSTITEVYFKGGVVKTATCTVTGSDSNDKAGAGTVSFNWGSFPSDQSKLLGSTKCSQSLTYSATSGSGDFTATGLDGTTANALMPLSSNKFFFFIPQAVSGAGIYVGIKYIDHLGVEQEKTLLLQHTEPWEAGKIYTYKLSPADIVDVLVTDLCSENVKDTVKVTNRGNVKEFIRVAVVGFWGIDDPSDGSIVINMPWQFNYSDPAFEGWNTADWTYNSSDGFFYSKTAVEPTATKVLFNKYTAPVGPDGDKLYIDIIAQAVAAGTATSWAGATGN